MMPAKSFFLPTQEFFLWSGWFTLIFKTRNRGSKKKLHCLKDISEGKNDLKSDRGVVAVAVVDAGVVAVAGGGGDYREKVNCCH